MTNVLVITVDDLRTALHAYADLPREGPLLELQPDQKPRRPEGQDDEL